MYFRCILIPISLVLDYVETVVYLNSYGNINNNNGLTVNILLLFFLSAQYLRVICLSVVSICSCGSDYLKRARCQKMFKHYFKNK